MSLRIRLIFNFPHFQILAISIVLSLLGISQIVFAIVAFVQKIWGFYIGSGLWGGCAAFLAGVAGIVAANTKGVCIVRTFLVTSLLSLLVTVPLLVLSAGGLDADSNFYIHHGLRHAKRNYSSTKLIHGFLLAFSIIQMGLSAITFFVCLKHLYLNGRTIRNRHAKQLTKLRVGTGDHILSRRSTSSSHAPLVTSSGYKPKTKHNRHSGTNRNSSANGDPLVDYSPEQRQHHGHRHHSRGGQRPRHTPSQPNSMEHMNFSLSADRQETIESLEMLQQSCDSHLERNITRAESSFQLSRERDTISHPLPIDEDEVLPPYEESLREIDGESVFPMSLSENCSNRESSSISSDDVSSGDDNVDVEVWESVSQTHLRTTGIQRSDVGISPTDFYTANPHSVSSQSPTAHDRALVGSQTFVTHDSGGIKNFQNITNNSSLEESAATDPQGVLYHGFSRNMDKIDNINKERKAQRSQSFQCERALARENLRSSGKSNKYHYDKDLRLSDIQGLAGDSVEIAPLKPPRVSLVECTSTKNKVPTRNIDQRTSWNAVDGHCANLSDLARPKIFSPPVLQNTSSNSNTKTVASSRIYPKEPKFASPHVHLHTTSMKAMETSDDNRYRSISKPRNVDVTTKPNSGNDESKYTDTGVKSVVGISLNPFFRPISQSAFVNPLIGKLDGNRLSKSGRNNKNPVPFPANISIGIENSPSSAKSCNSLLNTEHKIVPFGANSISKPSDSKICPTDSSCIKNSNDFRFTRSLQESWGQKQTPAVKLPVADDQLLKDKHDLASQGAELSEPVRQACLNNSDHKQQQSSGPLPLYPQHQKPAQLTNEITPSHSEHRKHTPQYAQLQNSQTADNQQKLPQSHDEQQSPQSERQPAPQNTPQCNAKQHQSSPQIVPVVSHIEKQPPHDQQPPPQLPQAEQPPPQLPQAEQPPPQLPQAEQPKQPPPPLPQAEQPPPQLPQAEQPPPPLPQAEQPPPPLPQAEQPPPQLPQAEQSPPQLPQAEQPPPPLPQAEQPPPQLPQAEQPPPQLPQAEQPPPHSLHAEQAKSQLPQSEQPPPHSLHAEQAQPQLPQVEQPLPHSLHAEQAQPQLPQAEQPQQMQNRRSRPIYSLLL